MNSSSQKLRAVQPPTDMARDTVRGRYTAGTIGTVVVLFLAALAAVVLRVVPPRVQQSDAVVDGVVEGLQRCSSG